MQALSSTKQFRPQIPNKRKYIVPKNLRQYTLPKVYKNLIDSVVFSGCLQCLADLGLDTLQRIIR